MDKEELDEMVVMPVADYEMMEADLDQAARFIDFLMQALDDAGEDPMALEMEFLQGEEITEGEVH
jgi:hypothetical protein